MISILFKFVIIYFSFNLTILHCYPIEDYDELDCGTQDDEVLENNEEQPAIKLIKHQKWPSPIIHFVIDCPNFSNEELYLLKTALGEIEAKTCIRFVRFRGDEDIEAFIHVRCKPDEGCKSKLGYQGKPQDLNLQLHRDWNPRKGGCMTIRKIQHEFMHALGFQHEHNSPIRDNYVKIVKENIAKGWNRYFRIDNRVHYDYYECPYDYASIMQVGAYRHSGNNQPTIISLDDKYGPSKLGRTRSLSPCDIKRIRKMYCSHKKKVVKVDFTDITVANRVENATQSGPEHRFDVIDIN